MISTSLSPEMADPRVFFYVQHLLGIGHLRRAAAICRALADAGFGVRMIAGGMPIPDLDTGGAVVEPLPPLRIGEGGFHDLVDVHGNRVSEAWKGDRRDRLLAYLAREPVDIVVTEAFPFGRRQMRFELLPLLDAAARMAPRPLIVCSVRDILKTDRKPGRAEETVDLVQRYYDAVLVHGDPALARLEETFPEATHFPDKVHYTGLVTASGLSSPDGVEGTGEIIVSAGGGAVGETLLSMGLECRALLGQPDRPMRLLAGPNLSDTALRTLRARASSGVTVERFRGDFLPLLSRCAVSVSQAGYNTVCDLICAGAKAVLVPFDADGENEQPFRAARLARRGLAQVVSGRDLSPETLALAIDRALQSAPMSGAGLKLDGAPESAAVLRRLLAGRG